MLIFSIVLSGLVFFLNSEEQKKQYENMLNRNVTLSEMILSVESIGLQFDLLNRYNNPQYYESYSKMVVQIQIIIDELIKMGNNDKKIFNYLRIIRNMNNHHNHMVTSHYTDTKGLSLNFEERKYIQILLSDMQRVIGEMTAYDLEYQNHINQKYFERLNEEQSVSFIILAGFITVLIIINIIMLTSITRKLKKIVYKSKALSKREWNVPDIDENSFEEFNQLAFAVNQMKRDIVKYISEMEEKSHLQQLLMKEKLNVEIKERLLKQSQLNALQAQVNPHFLFNTLNIIGKSAVMNDVDNVLQLIESISYMMRYVIDNQDALVTVDEEIELTKHYLGIQKHRFQNHFIYDIEIEEAARTIMMPSMVLQPIVENCIKHAYRNRIKDNYLKITVEMNQDYVDINIYDNGIGMDSETLKKVFEISPVGIANVSKRLEFEYNRSGLLTIESEVGSYTQVKLRIPREVLH